MKDVAKILAAIYGRQPTQAEIDHVRSIASVLNVSGNDEFLMFIACLVAYRNVFERIPELTVEKVREAAKLAEGMNGTGNREKTASVKEKAAWICGTAIVCLLLLGAAMFAGFKLGEESGLAQARKEVTIFQEQSMREKPSFKTDKQSIKTGI